MRKSNWKLKAVVIIAFIIGIVAGIVVAITFPEKYAMFKGLCAFGTIALVPVLIIFVAVKVLRIGED